MGAPLVFPAYAGMSPFHLLTDLRAHGFPRIRGDEPAKPITMFQFTAVFPAYAGMSPTRWNLKDIDQRFPRIRGDEPARAREYHAKKQFSPHTRG